MMMFRPGEKLYYIPTYAHWPDRCTSRDIRIQDGLRDNHGCKYEKVIQMTKTYPKNRKGTIKKFYCITTICIIRERLGVLAATCAARMRLPLRTSATRRA